MLINKDPLFKTQRIISLISVTLCLLGIITNLSDPDNSKNEFFMMNIITLSTMTVVFGTTAFINHKACRIIQIVIYIIVGIFSTIYGEADQSVGDLLILTGFVLIFYFRFTKKVSIVFLILVITLIVLSRLLIIPVEQRSLFIEIIVTMISSLLVSLIFFSIRDEISKYLDESQKHDSTFFIGLNTAGILHDFKLDVEIDKITYVLERIEDPKLKKRLTSVCLELTQKDGVRDDLLNTINSNLNTQNTKVNINYELKSIITLLKTKAIIFESIDFELNLSEELIIIDAVPNEVYLLFRNIITNGIESMLNDKSDNFSDSILRIATKVIANNCIIEIKDNGPGITTFKSSKQVGGFGLYYVNSILKKYNGKIKFESNNGTNVIITIPIK